MAFKYNYAIVSRIPESFSTCGHCINVSRAKEEHRQLIDTLKKCGVRVIEIQEDEEYPQCAFVDDCAVTIGGVALITRLGQKTRQGEVAEIRKVLKDLNYKLIEIKDPDAIVEGSDVFFTGKEIFVGIGEGRRTNFKGASAVAEAFPEYNVTPVKVNGGAHLKSLISMAGKDIIAAGKSQASEKVLEQIKELAQYSYRLLKLDSDVAANMLYVNSRLIHRPREEIGDRSYSVMDEKITYTRHKCTMSEIEKAHGDLSHLVLLLLKVNQPKEIVSAITTDDLTAYSDVWNM